MTMTMKNLNIKITFHSPWLCSSGLAAGAEADVRCIRDRQGLPYIPGRTLKGLIREAVENCVALSGQDVDLNTAFGTEATDAPIEGLRQGCLYFSDAELAAEERKAIVANGWQDRLYINKVSTAIDTETGIALDHSLRTMETVVPCTLHASILHVPDAIADTLARSLGWLKQMGMTRHRGLGRCTVSVENTTDDLATAQDTGTPHSTRLRFRCTLLTDIILSQRAATEGSHETLDFIPGNNFLGIVARCYGELSPELQAQLFHSGQVRFGDAHPVPAGGNVRSLRVPASFFYPKLSDVSKKCYIHHAYDRANDHESEGGAPQQLKQCRAGFYVFEGGQAQRVGTQKAFAIKSAYDRERRRARDSQMFGYESLAKDAEFLFAVECATEEQAAIVKRELVGNRHIGRSRTAQYGLVRIEPCNYSVPANATQPQDSLVTVYADSRLIFLDEAKEPTFQPTAQQLGFPDGEILWAQSQVRTFQYAPWNGKRQTRDGDRCGIEKGSVFVVKLKAARELPASSYVGCYQNEGFGRVLLNPDFLQAETGTNGRAKIRFTSSEPSAANASGIAPSSMTAVIPDMPLLDYLKRRQKAEADEQKIYEKVNEFVEANKRLFGDQQFASQWGTIRSIAMQCRTREELLNALYDKEKAYLTHGVAEEKWVELGRSKKLREFIDSMDEELAAEAVVNLASEMAKQSKKK